MKQKTSALSAFARPAIFLLMATIFFTSCGAFGKSNGRGPKGKVPSSYGTTGAVTTQQARLNYIDRFKGIAIREMERTG